MKKKCAVFTIVKNESYFLPIWINYYKRFFDISDIYVLDHQSDDGSTNNLDVNIIRVTNELHFDHQWLLETVSNFQKKLLQEYRAVLFAEADEIIYTLNNDLDKSIDIFLSSQFDYVTCKGYEIIQNLETEKSLGHNDSIISNRDYWFENSHYNKTLLSKVPLNWIWGFHLINNSDKTIVGQYGFALCHLHRVDFELMLKRHEERAYKWNLKDDGPGTGYQHRIGDRQGVLNYFNNINSTIVTIPLNHKVMLKI